MKRATLYIAVMAMMLCIAMASCHSTEANYKQAYDKAMAKHKEGVGTEAYEKIQAERVKYTHVINGDSVRMVRIYANVADDTATVGRRYNVIVGEFKQMFNAQSYRNRLKQEEGFPSYLLYGGPEKKYYVAIKGFDEKDVAAAFLKDLDKKVKMQILEPLPWILERY